MSDATNLPPGSLIACPVPAPRGVMKVRYLTNNGLYLGELELFARDQEALRLIAKRLYTAVTGVTLA